MVLEAGDRPSLTRDELALEQDVADHPLLAGHGLVREEADPRHRVAVAAEVAAPEQLVPAADREQRGAVRDGLRDRRALRGEVGRDQRLLAVLAAADVEEVVRARVGRRRRRRSASTSSSWPRSAARRESTAMFPRSA